MLTQASRQVVITWGAPGLFKGAPYNLSFCSPIHFLFFSLRLPLLPRPRSHKQRKTKFAKPAAADSSAGHACGTGRQGTAWDCNLTLTLRGKPVSTVTAVSTYTYCSNYTNIRYIEVCALYTLHTQDWWQNDFMDRGHNNHLGGGTVSPCPPLTTGLC